jgi:hypothetical protein
MGNDDNTGRTTTTTGDRLPWFAGALGKLEIDSNASPEIAIKLAYDHARRLRGAGRHENEFAAQVALHVEQPFHDNPLLIYVRAGFSAGYFFDSLPWRREIEASSRHQDPS